MFVDFPALYPRAIREHVSVCEQARHQSGRAFRIILRYTAHRGLAGVLFAALMIVGLFTISKQGGVKSPPSFGRLFAMCTRTFLPTA
ncbi:hypothetical protein EDM57_16570 [Brevibacillus gelatini]|uniref:Uncharacterized protein n=1 Tax=Brevibacillus gelatini TaxID=1655277 RepID=A0A3M8AUJ4_9BACL|nr:hypothetical protein EDM57_16570 [Brevibacillus gelatini]